MCSASTADHIATYAASASPSRKLIEICSLSLPIEKTIEKPCNNRMKTEIHVENNKTPQPLEAKVLNANTTTKKAKVLSATIGPLL
jgi:hypothetical protein